MRWDEVSSDYLWTATEERCAWHQNKVVRQLVAITGRWAVLVIRSICLEKSLNITAAGCDRGRETGMQIECFSFPLGGILPPVVFYLSSTWRNILVSAAAGNVAQIFIKKKKKLDERIWMSTGLHLSCLSALAEKPIRGKGLLEIDFVFFWGDSCFPMLSLTVVAHIDLPCGESLWRLWD